jgi:hypothetical protein
MTTNSGLSFHQFVSPPIPPITANPVKGCHLDYFGPANDPTLATLVARATEFCLSNGISGKAQLETLLASFFARAKKEHLAPEHDAIFLTIRITTPNDAFDIPRWHQDGSYWTIKENEEPYKIGTVLVGPPTLFLDSEDNSDLADEYQKSFDMFRADREKWPEERQRTFLAKRFEGKRVLQAGEGQVAKWLVGTKNAPIHSEPPMKAGRVFLSLLPGTEDQIRELCKRWKREFAESA